jgi:glucose/mannose transport system permease protein
MTTAQLPRPKIGNSRPPSRDRVISIVLIIPAVVAIAIFVYGMIGWSFWVSLSKANDLSFDMSLVGLKNYEAVFANQRFQLDLRNTIVFTVFFVGASLVIGLVLANLIDRRIRAEAIFRSLFLFPLAISFIVTGVVWKWLLTPTAGINLLFGLDPNTNRWFTDPTVLRIGDNLLIGIPIALFSLVIAAVWQMSGFVMALYLAALRGIPDELREAARVDGASEWQLFRRVILPLLTPVTVTAVIILGHISLKIYDLQQSMTGQGPGFATDFPASYMWQTAFKDNEFAKGAAVGIVMLALVATLIVPYLIWNRRQEMAR